MIEQLEQAGLEPATNGREPEAEPSVFDDVEAIFAADLPGKRIDFKMLERDCFVELRPMDADNFARWESAGQIMKIDPTRGVAEMAQVQVDGARQQMELLLGTVTEFAFARIRKNRSGEEMPEMTLGASLDRKQREQLFRSLSREFRQRLVTECLKVNGVGPFAGAVSGGPSE